MAGGAICSARHHVSGDGALFSAFPRTDPFGWLLRVRDVAYCGDLTTYRLMLHACSVRIARRADATPGSPFLFIEDDFTVLSPDPFAGVVL